MKFSRKKKYNYSDDINREKCKHSRKQPHDITSDWEIDTVNIIVECKDCHKIGETQGKISFYDADIEWSEDIEGKEVRGKVPKVKK